MPSRRATLIPAIALAAILIAAIQSSRGLNVRPASAPAGQFSAERALATLRSVIGGNVPHPIGTAADDAVRERITAHLAGLGYLVQVQRTFACDGYGTCGNVANIIARRPGDPARPGIVLAAHYDSVPAGPGAADDGIGVATLLEIARAIRQEPFKNPPVFLIDDGEEAGLLGAEGFAHDPDLLRSTAMVINVEARGTTGPSLLFETSRMNRWLVDHAVSRQRRPVTSSLFATIYDLLPNDTDLTVFKRAGVQGVNFGIIGYPSAYHTPLDTLENLNPRSLQHHGDNALDVLRGVGNAEMGTSDENAVWFDVLTRFVVHWPERATIWIAIASCIALIIASLLLVREDRSQISDIVLGAVAFVVSLALSAAGGFAIASFGRLRASGATWVAHPEPLIVAMWIAAVIVTLFVFAAIRRRAGAEGLQLGCAFAWHAIAIALALRLTGASYLFVVPAVALSIWSLIRAFGVQFEGDIALPAIAAAIVFFPFGLRLHDALGAPSLTVIAVLISIVMTTVAAFAIPVARLSAIIIFAALFTSAMMGFLIDPYDERHPQRSNIQYVVDGQNAHWIVNAPTVRVRGTAAFQRDSKFFPWLRESRFESAAAPLVSLPPVQLSVERDDRLSTGTIRWRVRSQRSAPRVAIYFRTDAKVGSLRINGTTPPPLTRGSLPFASGWHRAVVRGSEASVEVTLASRAPIDVIALDYTYGAPPAGGALVAARDASNAVASDDGDVTITMSRAQM